MGKEIFFSGIIRELNILWTVSQSLFHLYFREVMGRSSSLSFFCLWCLLGGGWYFLEGQCKDHSWQEQPRWSDFPLEALKLWDSAMLKDHCSEFLSARAEQVLIWPASALLLHSFWEYRVTP